MNGENANDAMCYNNCVILYYDYKIGRLMVAISK